MRTMANYRGRLMYEGNVAWSLSLLSHLRQKLVTHGISFFISGLERTLA